MRERIHPVFLTLISALICLFLLAEARGQSVPNGGWAAWGHDAGGTRYSRLTQINRDTVKRLKVAWVYHTGALQPKTFLNQKAAFEATPILDHGTLYLSTPFDQVIALNAQTGEALWRYDPKLDRSHGYSEVSSRGVALWHAPAGDDLKVCATRIFAGTLDGRLIALDAATGKPCADFGQGGTVNLKIGVDYHHRGDYQETSPPTVVNNVVVVGSSIADNVSVHMEKGTVRGYDARTGKLLWSWNPLPPGMESGAGNAWSVLSADPKRDMVFVPTGSPSPDYFGGYRLGDDRDADSVVALRASTGKKLWAFQVVHHDLWDYDVPSQPTLVTVHKDGRAIPAVVVTTKIGNLFLLNRLTGKPILPVEEKPVPQSDVPGEKTAATQPFPLYDPLVEQGLTPKDAWGLTAAERSYCRERIEKWPSKLFTPPRLGWTIQSPGNIGGVDWGSGAWDPKTGLYIMATNRVPFRVRLLTRKAYGPQAYSAHKDLPIENRIDGEFAPQSGAPYGLFRQPFFSPHGLPCFSPPWGSLVAMDLATGMIRWKVPLGHTIIPAGFDGNAKPVVLPGAINLGGPMVTAGGLVFVSATRFDDRLHVYDARTGKDLLELPLPAGGQSIPMTYEVDGKQYVVICAGGHGKLGTKMGDDVVAYTLQ